MKFSTLLFILAMAVTINGCSQGTAKIPGTANKAVLVGDGCEGCEAIYESPLPLERLPATDTLPDYDEEGVKIGIRGIVYQRDGHTPASDVVMYIYHTDQQGYYSTRGTEKGWGKRHGYIRGWVKTDKNGFYQFYTLVPASYPNSNNPKHIHPVIKEAGKNEYWIDEFLFDDDPYLTAEYRKTAKERGGNGILKTTKKDGILLANRDIILGLNVPGYPGAKIQSPASGLELGANCPAFDPLHLSGPDKGKKACPMCKYGFGQGVMIWFNHANLHQMQRFARQLEKEMAQRGEKKFRVFLVYMNPSYQLNTKNGQDILQQPLERWGRENGLQKVALLTVPSPVDKKTCGEYDINPAAKNTVLIYKKRTVVAKWVNIAYDNEALHNIMKAIDSPL
ncbi:MAG: hypothetical protein WKI04_00095 [Ferruginibacter sp.]